MPKRSAKKSATTRSTKTASRQGGASGAKAARNAKKKVAKSATSASKRAGGAARGKSAAPGKARAKKGAAKSVRADDGRLAHLQQLIELMVEKDVVEVELEEAGARWRVRRQEQAQAVTLAPAPAAQMVGSAPPHFAGSPAAAGRETGEGSAEPEGETYPSPMLGTFYRAPSPDAEPFVKPGDKVTAETTVCIIEAMKVMNEIKAEREFEILDILVKNGDPVEFGQPLFLIR